MPRLSPSTLAHLLLLGVVAVWGATFSLVKDSLNAASPLLFNLLRMTLAAIALAIVNRRHLRHITRRTLTAGAIVGLFFDSLLGAVLERRGWLNNDAVNALSTLAAALFAAWAASAINSRL